MAFFQALGVDSTILYQFIFAAFSFFALSSLVFKPYTDALLEREHRTVGGESEAVELTKQAADLRSVYENKAREINSQMKTIYDSYRLESAREVEALISKARAESQKVIEETRAKVSVQVAEASHKMKEEIPALAQAISTRLLSKKA